MALGRDELRGMSESGTNIGIYFLEEEVEIEEGEVEVEEEEVEVEKEEVNGKRKMGGG